MTTTGRRALAGLALLGGAAAAWGVGVERRWYALRRRRLESVMRSGATLRLLHVSDVHLAPPQRSHVEAFRRFADLEYDLVVATGDLLGAEGAERPLVEALRPLTADGRPGLVVLGSNDWYAPAPKTPFVYFQDPDRRDYGARLDTAALVRGLHATGWRVLCNERAVVDVAGRSVAVAGIDDPHLHETVIPDPREIAAPREGVDLALGLVHAPYVRALDALVESGHDLLLAGHTHGGQVRVPGVGALVANCDLPLDRVRGVSRYRGRWLHVSAGLGHSRYAPIRFACRPEVTLLDLV